MMKHGYGAQNYLRTQVEAATPVELVVLLYDAALRSADAAHDALVARDIHARRPAISKLMDIIAELQANLDMERGGTVAAELDRLYTYMISRLLTAVSDQDPKPVDEVRKILRTIADAWRHIATVSEKKSA
jgi:flagellar protein FliS